MAKSTVELGSASNTIIGGYAVAIVRALEARGVAASAIPQSCGLASLPANDPLARLPMAMMHRLLNAAVHATGDPYFGLYASRFLHVSHLHALGFAMLASGSLRELCERLTRHFRLLSMNCTPRLRETQREAHLEFPRVAEAPPLNDDIFGLFLVNLVRELSDDRAGPTSIELHRPMPPDGGARHERAFGCRVTFEAPFVSFNFERAALDAPFSGANPELAAHNERIVVGYLAKLDRADIQTRVRSLLLRELASGNVTKQDIAKRLCMSPRTLQVKLSKSNTTFQDIVNETRHALARGYLANSELSITDIAYLLGFSDSSNFSRAFRRWTGRSPRAHADQLRRGAFTPDRGHPAQADDQAVVASNPGAPDTRTSSEARRNHDSKRSAPMTTHMRTASNPYDATAYADR